MKFAHHGFTLVELIVVIVILGILAATALPRFVTVTADARESAARGISGAVNAASGLVQARYHAKGGSGTTVTTTDGTVVTVAAVSGFPSAAAGGIDNALGGTTDITFVAGTALGVATFRPSGGNLTNCFVQYSGTTGVASAVLGGC